MSLRRSGATEIIAPIYTPIAAILPKPQHAYVAMTIDRSCNVAVALAVTELILTCTLSSLVKSSLAFC